MSTSTTASSDRQTLQVSRHVRFIQELDTKKDDLFYWLSEHLRLNGVYWGLTALALLGQPDALDRSDVIDYILSCQHASGGFGGHLGHDAHLSCTLSAVQVLVMLDALDRVDCDKIAEYVARLQDPETGAFMGDHWGEIDTRFSFSAVACLSLMDRLSVVDVDKASEFVLACQNPDGGFGSIPGAESHAGQIFCCLGFLSIVDRLEYVDVDTLGWWLCERQLGNGGLNGRPEKKEDVCYSWWVLSSLSIIGKLDWIDRDKLVAFILRCQDDESGGFADREGHYPDVFHTLFGIAGLSLLGYDGLNKVDPVYCMPLECIKQLGLHK
ncbi:terpenoid cyclases/protein prenyltransferase alpha-alpha toroid [Syncephalis pseudoplumigaleata]|uniref:Geranylgeranyl transferase type-2 subunit beta n=1 Tax=Syncephalis pseudoplumigaleata TaxID=1712513 RepID=A0A4P9YV84_9FUNG|nr:terpenoid cyclases/protein prenyltransferase alpha-alpha toroid [Syncephalis pseudoplumigaleata]|eukprot:RKP23963.1 terpenoid cyclases/protein prenyltransferase alpha-alpha toroid [Syncephalis pseudoplumigaleata]